MRTTGRLRFVWLMALVAIASLALVACRGEDEEDEEANVPGVTEDRILLGTHTPLTGSVAVYSPISKAVNAYFQYVNQEQGGVHGRRIEYLVEDDAYSPPQTVQVVTKLVEQDQIFAMLNGLGTPTHEAVLDYLEESGVPDMYIASGATRWTEPLRKTVFGFQPDYVTEGTILGTYIAENFSGRRVGLLYQNDDFGRDGIEGLKKGIGNRATVVAEVSYEAGAPDLSSQVLRLREAGAEVIGLYATPAQAGNAIGFAKQQGYNVPWVVSSVAGDFILRLLRPEQTAGIISISYLKQPYETDDPDVQKHLDILQRYGGGEQASNFTMYGQCVAELMVETLNRAGERLTRTRLVEAAESIRDWRCSLFSDGVEVNLSESDHKPLESGYIVQAEGNQWRQVGELINYESTQ